MSARAIWINVLVVLIVLAGAGAGIYYYNQNANFVKTDNAQVGGQTISIYAPVAGKLTTWNAKVGQAYSAGQRIGSIQSAAGATDITIPLAGTIVQQSGVPHSFVAAGTSLGRAYDFDNLWVTANIDETSIPNIQVGQTVDVYVDAFPSNTLTGKVDSIGLATSGTFSLLPTSNSNANYTKVAQVIPVVITIEGYKGLGLVPGMNATVKVHI
ncbi:multidrug resistance efflux pump [Paenibacillus shirakamiensis]|uniref:Multidrug resistance efflux pump n=1 Tax=Paenibacillus shirakamiensis TaxID=1265935 RepID=A0ABS4JJL8_9BACL|nr:HlyD family efflux transporter periplasmic adaptor subunit [Paenibacillus shirakamiensis]MBP2001908.1 multidrug resistance efflux pump [Paenibacillus shirakamiensis]